MRLSARLVLAILCSIVGASPAFAQDGKTPHWGVGFSFTPTWKANQTFQDLLLVEGEPLLEGNEFTIGVARGSTLGGDWGVSYVRKPFKDGFTVTDSFESAEQNTVYRATTTSVFRNVYYQGVEVHGFFPFVNIKDRVQIGVNVAGGVASVKGTIEQTFDSSFTFTPPSGPPQTQTDHYVETLPANEVLFELQPLGKVEVQASVIVIPSLKVKISAGMNMPSAMAFRIGAVYLIGAK